MSNSSRKALLLCGLVSSLLYAAMNVFIPLWWDGYSSFSQTISELSAIDAPTRPLWFPLGIVYTLLVAAFGVGVWTSALRDRPLRVLGGLLVAYGIIGVGWPPMHQRAVIAAGGATLTDTMHIAWSVITVVLMLFEIWFGAAARGLPVASNWRLESWVTLVVGVMASRQYSLLLESTTRTSWTRNGSNSRRLLPPSAPTSEIDVVERGWILLTASLSGRISALNASSRDLSARIRSAISSRMRAWLFWIDQGKPPFFEPQRRRAGSSSV